METLIHCNSVFFRNIFTLMQIFVTLPVSTATGERSFSSLAYLKNYRRSTMNADRLNGLALMFIHREMTSDEAMDSLIDKTVDRFARYQQQTRRIVLF